MNFTSQLTTLFVHSKLSISSSSNKSVKTRLLVTCHLQTLFSCTNSSPVYQARLQKIQEAMENDCDSFTYIDTETDGSFVQRFVIKNMEIYGFVFP